MIEALKFTPDAKQRETALDPAHSFIVQAPAGSGKTTLLVQRYLALLATVKSPEEIIAITFTRKAAAEMQNRILDALEQVAQHTTQANDKTILLAKKALHKDHTEKWHLLQNPRRLRIQTIDALCGYLASRVPISSGIGSNGEIAPTENLEKYYHLAAENLLRNTMGADNLDQQQKQSSPLANLLLHLDNDQDYLIKLCADLLKKREQWLPHIISAKQQYQPEQLRHILEQGLQNSICENLEKCHHNFPKELFTELDCLINFAISNLKNNKNLSPILSCPGFAKIFLDKNSSLNINNLKTWLGLSELLLKKDGGWHKAVNKKQGFPSKDDAQNKEEKQLFAEMKERMKELLAQLEQCETFRQALLELRVAPSPTYSNAQWQVLYSLLEILPLLVAQLKLIFQEEGAADYTEISMAADHALGYSDAPSELALNLDYRIKHLLVDEFQDTSLAQYRLLEKLTTGWESGDGRTLFLVGDPMQSIYRFRQAEVGLFLRAQNEGIGNIALQSLQLTANFRSHFAIINWLNSNFPHILPSVPDIAAGGIPFTPCEASAVNNATVETPNLGVSNLGEAQTPKCETPKCETPNLGVSTKVLVDGTSEDEAHCIANKIKHILRHQTQSTPTIAILLQARTHAEPIIKTLKIEQIPYQAVELESLKSSIVIQDLFSLTRALTDLGDKIAWLAILRAPWCGLSLHDLHSIANHRSPTVWQNICAYQSLPTALQLSSDGDTRIKRFIQAVQPSLKNRAQSNLRSWIEEAWLQLGAPACYTDSSSLEDAEKYFTLLEKYPTNNFDFDLNTLKQQLENLYLSTNLENARVQIMTIHKAKGLEFDHVIVAGLNHKTQSDTDQLLLWLEQPRIHGGCDLLLAPIKEAGEKESEIYRHLKAIEQKKNYNEISRLLYVAATRAKKSLHFFATLSNNDEEENENEQKNAVKTPSKGSLLKHLWSCFHEDWLDKKYSKKTDIIANNENKKPIDEIVLSRLSNDWQSPSSSVAVETPNLGVSHSSVSHSSVSTAADDTATRLGTVIHQCLQKLAYDIERNPQSFINSEKYISSQKTRWEKLLFQAGFYHNLPAQLKKIALALENMQKDLIGKWILNCEHREIHNEYAITTITNSETKHLIIDRTFIDNNNTRWIIDYKTSTPNDIALEEFLKHELEKYQPQLEQYALAFRKIETHPIWLGLYFPMCQGWIKWEFVNG